MRHLTFFLIHPRGRRDGVDAHAKIHILREALLLCDELAARGPARPALPVARPVSPTLAIVWESVKTMCAAPQRPSTRPWPFTTTATCRLEEPLAMTRMFKLALARELTKLADTPDLIAMPSLTIATMGTSVRHIEFTSERESSSSNADLRERLSAMVDTEQHVKKYIIWQDKSVLDLVQLYVGYRGLTSA
jgi:hypothetical protein